MAELSLGLFFALCTAQRRVLGGTLALPAASVSKVETNSPVFTRFATLRALRVDAFATMDGKIDPPSSGAAISRADSRAKATVAPKYLFVIRATGMPAACLFAIPKGARSYIRKLAVARNERRQGYTRVSAAASRARAPGLPTLDLQSHVALLENHAAVAALGSCTSVQPRTPATTAKPG